MEISAVAEINNFFSLFTLHFSLFTCKLRASEPYTVARVYPSGIMPKTFFGVGKENKK